MWVSETRLLVAQSPGTPGFEPAEGRVRDQCKGVGAA